MAGKKKHASSVTRRDGRPRTKPAGYRSSGSGHSEWVAAFWRWSVITAIMGVLFLVYEFHPYYQGKRFDAWHPFFTPIFLGWVLLGIPYVVSTRRTFGGRKMDLTDGAMHWMLWFRGLYFWARRGCRWPRHIWSNRRMRTSVLSLGVKAFFTPLMWCFMVGHMRHISSLWLKRKGVTPLTPEAARELTGQGWEAWWGWLSENVPRMLPTFDNWFNDFMTFSAQDYWWWSRLIFQLLFFTDTIWALTGYAVESRWLNNKTRSVEPTLFGWMVALMCYPPFNDVTGMYFPQVKNEAWRIISNESLLIACNVAMLGAFTIYVAATLAFGPTFSNLTNRGIITRGPYAWVRHPAYAAKNFAWWMEYLPYLGNWQNVFSLLAWNIVYGLRAWTEERHLSRDPDYVAYKKKVRWAFIPGIF